MKLKYQDGRSVFSMMNEGLGVLTKQRKLRKKKNIRTFCALTYGFINLIPTFFLVLLTIFLFSLNIDFFFLSWLPILIVMELGIHFVYFTSFFVSFFRRKREKRVGKLLINEEGIRDVVGKKDKVFLPWNEVLLVVSKKYSLTILSRGTNYIIIASSFKDKVITAIRKYNPDIQIVVGKKGLS